MLISEFLKVINDVEARFPVAQWRLFGIDLWPVIRIHLSIEMFESTHAKPAAPGRVSRLGRRVKELAHSAALLAGPSPRLGSERTCIDLPAAAVFLSDGISFAGLAGADYEKFCDPMIDHLRLHGQESVLLSPMAKRYRLRHSRSQHIQPRLDWLRIRAIAEVKLARLAPGADELPQFDAVMDHLRSHIPAFGFSPHGLTLRARYVALASRYFQSILASTHAHAGFVVSYYSLVGYAFCHACNAIGIRSVDLQHGAIGDSHPAYCAWRQVPTDGYNVLPSHFWCWSDDEVTAITNSGSQFALAHTPIRGANLLQDIYLSGGQLHGSEVTERLQAVHDSDRRVHNILLTLQPGLIHDELMGVFREVIRQTATRCRWWVRLHPAMLEQRHHVCRVLEHEGILVDLATEAPLYALLGDMDAHMTYSSSTVVEAAAFGVRSVILSKYGAELFPSQLNSGAAVVAETAPEIAAAILSQIEQRGSKSELKMEAQNRLRQAYGVLDSIVGRESVRRGPTDARLPAKEVNPLVVNEK